MDTQTSIACNATRTRIVPFETTYGKSRYAVHYLTDTWHMLPVAAIDREQAKRFADELKRSK